MTPGGRRRVLLEKRAVIGLSYLILFKRREAKLGSGLAAAQ